MKRSLNIAHRGFSGKYPENTMIAFIKAVEAGCNGIETDLHMTKDGIIVICHDETINRTTNGEGFIHDYTYEELCRFDAGIKFSEEFRGEKIPSLDEFLDYVKDKNLLLNLELKNDIIAYSGLEKKVIDKVCEFKLEKNVLLSSFNHYSMIRVKQYNHSIKTGLLYEAILYNAHEYIKTVGADALHPSFPAMMDEKIVNNIKKNGIMINAYTVDDEKHMKRLIELKIDGIITNYPDKLNKVLQGTNCL
ncbi:glycerophosphodiester phosphodiesterase [Clostridium sp. OS1-26]|uniref:glycerophosphodiester phosphodiesterase n=1 Tax=Clostridium sp. OS1-26 TaxID=3070681 RepID=UPI0027E003D8|nr:glycerophosphodiester phosphodiesterase [Clostridium sp. OS1-26]WML34814.1 glycerophosphodiester phosphodiesterase [Clostridium sp. OS1-26]